MARRALMIGINQYANLALPYQLKGCVNDQRLLHRLLTTRYNFDPANVTLLLDGEATRERILDELDRLAGIGAHAGRAAVEPGDLVVISYSGHGSRLKEPDDRKDEANGYDSTLVPADSDRPRPDGRGGRKLDITDDELHQRFRRIQRRAGHLFLYFDCCRSGTIARDLEGDVARTIPDAQEGYDDVERLDGFGGSGARSLEAGEAAGAKGASGWLPLNDGYTLLAGCADDEKAQEHRPEGSDEKFGALTWFLVQELERSREPLTYRDLIERVRGQVTARYPQQHPQFEGKWNQRFLSLDEVPVEPFAPVEARLGDRAVRLAVGAAQGATVGSRWALRPATLADNRLLAEVRLRQVGALSSEAETVDGAALPAEVQPGGRALLLQRAWGDFRVPVAVEGDEQASEPLRRAIAASDLLRLAERAEAQMLAALLPARDAVDESADLAPNVGQLTEPTWAIVGRDRALLPLPPHAASAAGALADTLSNLETWARYLHVLALAAQQSDDLRGAVTIRLLRHRADGQHEPLWHDGAAGLPAISEGERILIELTNQRDEPLFATLLDLGVTGSVKPVWPPAGQRSESLAAKHTVTLGLAQGGLRLMLPASLPAVLSQATEHFQVMVTRRFVDFSTLAQGGGRTLGAEEGSGRGFATPLGQLFAAAMQGSRDLEGPILDAQPDPAEAWGVAQASVALKRRP